MDIRTCIQHLTGATASFLSLARIVQVDEARAVCKVALSDGTELPSVRLRALTDSEGAMLLIPKTGSEVIVGFLSPAEAVVLLYTEVSRIQLNKGENGGLVIAEKITEALNALQQQLNDLKQTLNTWTPVPNDGGAALKASLTAWNARRIATTQAQSISNPSITH